MTVLQEYSLLWSVSPPKEAVECGGIVMVVFVLYGSLNVCRINMCHEYQQLATSVLFSSFSL